MSVLGREFWICCNKHWPAFCTTVGSLFPTRAFQKASASFKAFRTAIYPIDLPRHELYSGSHLCNTPSGVFDECHHRLAHDIFCYPHF